jgi:diguanylate cyclase (GGDEF)-like protein
MNQMAVQLADHRRQLEELSRRDGLTGLFNKREFSRILQEQVERYKRHKHPFHLLMMDLDHFKNVNDTYGHLAGDDVLKAVAAAIRREARTLDHVARYGGEEMVLILPETDPAGALVMAERVRSAVAALKIPVAASKEIGVTLSLGVAGFPADADSAEALIAAADQALYAAKEAGRNRVLYYPELDRTD